MKPIIYWMDSAHTAQVKTPFDFNVIDAGDTSNAITFNIWNNKGGETDTSKMEECTITTRDMKFGLGDEVGNIVQSVRDNWFHVQVDSLGETDLSESTSKIGADFSKTLGTTGTTKHRKSLNATAWVASTAYTIGASVNPTVANGYVYVCTTVGTSASVAPTWAIPVDESGTTVVNDGSVVWKPVKISNKPNAKEILGVSNDGTALNSAGNFATVTVQVEVPLNADSGKQQVKLRVSYKYV